jgi:rhodanese-related sulfurtransferase
MWLLAYQLNNMQKKIFIPFIIWLLAVGLVYPQTAFDAKLKSIYRNTVPQVKGVEVREWEELNQKVILIDARTEAEYKVSHIPGAISVGFDGFKEADVLSIDHNAEIVVYCTVGYRSERLGEKLLELGFTNVRNLYGGILEWANEDGPLLNTRNQPTDSVHTFSESWAQWLTHGVKVH